MIVVFVRYYLTAEGVQYVHDTWFPEVLRRIKPKPGFVSVTLDSTDLETGLVEITVIFEDKPTLEAWVAHPDHKIVDDLDRFRIRDAEVAQADRTDVDPSTLQWLQIPSQT